MLPKTNQRVQGRQTGRVQETNVSIAAAAAAFGEFSNRTIEESVRMDVLKLTIVRGPWPLCSFGRTEYSYMVGVAKRSSRLTAATRLEGGGL